MRITSKVHHRRPVLSNLRKKTAKQLSQIKRNTSREVAGSDQRQGRFKALSRMSRPSHRQIPSGNPAGTLTGNRSGSQMITQEKPPKRSPASYWPRIPSLTTANAETVLRSAKRGGPCQNIRKISRNTLENVSRRLEEFN